MRLGNKNIISLQYGSKSIVKAMFGSKIVWEKSGQVPDVPEIPEIPEEPEDTPDLITFTIAGIEYQAEEGMTWEQWVDSEYNHELSGTLYAFEVGLITTVSNDYIVYAKGSISVGVQHTFNKFNKKVDPVSISEVIESKEYNIFEIWSFI